MQDVRTTRPQRPVRRGRVLRVLPFAAVAAVALAGIGLAEGGFTSTVGNPASASGTGSLQLSAAVGGTTECATSVATPNASCAGTLASSTLAAGTTSQAVSTKLTATGTLAPTMTKLTLGTCAPIPLANRRAASDPMLIRGGVTNQTSSVYGDGAALTLGGSSGFASNVTAVANPQSFTETIWFKATGGVGGSLMGFSNTPAVGPSHWDRMIWIDNTGLLVFGVYNGATKVVTSPTCKSYLDNAWHLAAASISAAGEVLYVDGASVASNASNTTAENVSGYWHVGWENENTGWPDPPTNPYFAGSLTNAAIFPVLTAAQITKLYQAGSQATWNADIAGGNGVTAATSAWQLGDPATGQYAGTPSWLTPDPCSLVDATIQAAAASPTCSAPAVAGACPAPSSAVTLDSLSGTAVPVTSPTPAQPVTVTITTARDAANTTGRYPNLLGLHLNLGGTVAASAGSFAGSLTWPATQNIPL